MGTYNFLSTYLTESAQGGYKSEHTEVKAYEFDRILLNELLKSQRILDIFKDKTLGDFERTRQLKIEGYKVRIESIAFEISHVEQTLKDMSNYNSSYKTLPYKESLFRKLTRKSLLLNIKQNELGKKMQEEINKNPFDIEKKNNNEKP